jgi:predicted tellurium resistance membrane protein TerC
MPILDQAMTLAMLTLLQVVLGFDNLLYISLESKRAPLEKQAMVRRWGIGMAIGLRILLLFVLMQVIQYFQNPIIHMNWTGWVEGEVNVHSLIVLMGGAFIIYTATKEIWHMMSLEQTFQEKREPRSVRKTILWIVLMNLVFSFDSILSAMALTKIFWVMAVAILMGGVLMIWMADRVSEFLKKNRMYEVLGLFILFIVGIMLVSEGGHLAHLTLFGQKITSMSKATFYFVISVLLMTDIVQSRYQKKILQQKTRVTSH